MKPLAFLVAAVITITFLAADAPSAAVPDAGGRPFHLGFTRWPADLTAEGARVAEEFAHAHGDIVSVMFIGGIPWPEALDGREFSRDVRNSLQYHRPAGKKLFLSVSPLDKDRKNLAPYWGEKDNQPLPDAWRDRALNNPATKRAFLNFVRRAVEAMNPDYLAIGIESNVLLSHNRGRWEQLKELHRETYAAMKNLHPNLPVFFTTEVLHYRKLASDARASDLMQHSDLFAMSVYPHMSYDVPRPIPADFLDFARRFGKPIAVSESGMTSKDVELRAFGLTLRGSEPDQKQFTELLLQAAARNRYEFVITFATTDFEKLCAKLPPPLDDLGRIWAYTGLQTSDLKPKPALVVWDGWLARPHDGPRVGRAMADILATSTTADWRPLDPENTLYLEFASGRVVIELAPAFAPRHVENVKSLARERYYDGLAIVRVQDNYVAQWGDPDAEKPEAARTIRTAQRSLPPEFECPLDLQIPFTRLPDGDVYAPEVGFTHGFPVARDRPSGKMWLVHTYGMVGAGRGPAADSGGGAELYAVIGHAPRHLDRNVTLLGRVVHGMELLSALPRGPFPTGFYEKPEQRVPIQKVRVAADVPESERSQLEVMRTESKTFQALIESRRNRPEEWFKFRAGRIELSNVPIPVRAAQRY